MKNNKIIDFNVRVWGNTVFIGECDTLNYMRDTWADVGGLQCNFEIADTKYNEVRNLCDEIADRFVALKEVLSKE